MAKTTSRSGEDTLTILDVGHGNCAVLASGGKTVVIDTGSGSALLEYLAQKHMRALDTVVLTHADQDHIGGLVGLISSRIVDVNKVYVNADSVKGSSTWDDLLYELDHLSTAKKIKLYTALTRTNTGELDLKGAKLEILSPTPYLAAKGPGSVDRDGRRIASNTISIVIRIGTKGASIALLASDLDSLGLDHLLATESDLSAPVLVFPHHGGRPGIEDGRSFAGRICSVVSPHTVVFSTGRGRYGTPNPDVVAGVLKARPECWIVCTQLSEACATVLPKSEAQHLSGVHAQGREEGNCCAGTIVIQLRKPMDVTPTRDSHALFVRKEVDTPLCRKRNGANRSKKRRQPLG